MNTASELQPLLRTKLYPPSSPDDCVSRGRFISLLDQALDVPLTVISALAIGFNKTKLMFPTALYGKDSGWEDAMAGMNPKIDLPTYSEFNERTSYGFEATTTSAGMVSRTPGKGSAYLGSYYQYRRERV